MQLLSFQRLSPISAHLRTEIIVRTRTVIASERCEKDIWTAKNSDLAAQASYALYSYMMTEYAADLNVQALLDPYTDTAAALQSHVATKRIKPFSPLLLIFHYYKATHTLHVKVSITLHPETSPLVSSRVQAEVSGGSISQAWFTSPSATQILLRSFTNTCVSLPRMTKSTIFPSRQSYKTHPLIRIVLYTPFFPNKVLTSSPSLLANPKAIQLRDLEQLRENEYGSSSLVARITPPPPP